VSKLLNFTKDKVNYGVYFMEPVNPEKDGIPNYRKLVQNPMDLGTIMNRLYLDFYKNAQQFWIDLGLVFKNCRLVFRDPDCDIRILCDTLREANKN
jgi:chromodomain-helicase-DNA-binding protein 7